MNGSIRDEHPGKPTQYEEVRIGGTLYCVTSVFLGEKDLGQTLESLAVSHVLKHIDEQAKAALENV